DMAALKPDLWTSPSARAPCSKYTSRRFDQYWRRWPSGIGQFISGRAKCGARPVITKAVSERSSCRTRMAICSWWRRILVGGHFRNRPLGDFEPSYASKLVELQSAGYKRANLIPG